MKKISALLFSSLMLSAVVLSPIANSEHFFEYEKNFHGIKATPFYDRSVTSEPLYSSSNSYQFNYMNVGNTWDTVRGDNVTVAVIDSGINIFHEDFLKESAKGVTVTTSNINTYSTLNPRSCNIYDSSNGYYSSSVKTQVGIQYALDDDTYDSENEDYYSHGTCSAGCIGAAVNGVGTAGLAPNVSLLIIKMDFYFTSLDKSIRYAADNGADIINMSLGAYAESFVDGNGRKQTGDSSVATALQSAIDYAHNKGCVILASAGNENQGSHKSYPACNNHVIGVGALASKSGTNRASFSNWNVTNSSGTILSNNNVDVTAPGYVYVPMVDDAANSSHYGVTQGTSFSCPLTSAACALYKSKYPTSTNTDIENALYASCDDIGTTGFDKIFGNGRVNVSELLAEEPTIKVTEVNVSPSSSTIYVDGNGGSRTVQLSASFSPTNADEKYKEGLWISNNDNVATIDEETGLVTAVSAGTTQVGFLTEYGIEGYADIIVKDNNTYSVTGISLDKTSTKLGIGATVQLNETITPNNATNKNVIWTSSNSDIASVTNGLVKALKAGTTTITVTTVDGNYSASCEVTVRSISETTYGLLGGVEDLSIGDKIAIVANSYSYAMGSQNSNNRGQVAITKDSSTYDVPTIEKVSGVANLELREGLTSGTYSFYDLDNNGYLYAASSSSNHLKVESTLTSNSSFNITYTSNYFTLIATGSNSKNEIRYNNSSSIFSCYSTGQQPVTLYQPLNMGEIVPVTGVTLDKTTASVDIGKTLTLNATVLPENATNKRLTWTSSDTNVATVSNGVVTAKTVGTTTITVTSANGISAICSVTVNPIHVESVTLSKTSLTLIEGQSQTLTATISPSNATNKNFTWSSLDTSVATVSGTGSVKAIKAGTTKIKATASDNNISGSCDVTVIAKAITKIAITSNASKTSFYVGDTFSRNGLVVKATWNDNTVTDVTSLCTYSTPDMLTPGTKTITISYAGFETSYTISVVEVVVSSIVVTSEPTKVSYEVGEAFDPTGLVVTAKYNNGTTLVVTDSCTLSTPNMDEAGTKVITVTYGVLSTSFEIVVKDPSSTSIYSISFMKTSDGSTSLSNSDLLAQVENGGEYISSFDNISKVYPGKSGLKLGSNNAAGSFRMNLNNKTVTEKISSIVLYSAQYGTDGGELSISVNGSVVKSKITPSSGETIIELANETTISSISISTSSKRAYVSGLDLVYSKTKSAEIEASKFAKAFLDDITCSGTGSVTFSNIDWLNLSIEFVGLSQNAQDVLKNATANQYGSDIEKCVARYDYIVAKYGTTTYEDFMGRNPSNKSPLIKSISRNDSTSTLVFGSMISITSIGIMLFKALKKKEQ